MCPNKTFIQLINPEDARTIFGLIARNKQYLGTYLEWVENTHSETDIINFIKTCDALYRQKKGAFFSVYQGAELCGVVGATIGKEDGSSYNITYWISKIHSRKGITSTAVDLLINYLFEDWNIGTFCAVVDSHNISSQMLLKKCGFVLIMQKDNFFFFERRMDG